MNTFSVFTYFLDMHLDVFSHTVLISRQTVPKIHTCFKPVAVIPRYSAFGVDHYRFPRYYRRIFPVIPAVTTLLPNEFFVTVSL